MKVNKYWAEKISSIREKGYRNFTTQKINLHSKSINTDLPEGYELSNIYSKYYSLDELRLIDNEELYEDLSYIKMIYDELSGSIIGDFKTFNNDIIRNNSIEELNELNIDKNYDISLKISKLNNEKDVPRELKFDENYFNKKNHIK